LLDHRVLCHNGGRLIAVFPPLEPFVLVLGTQFAGGVFLGTAMIHFLGDSSSTFQSLTTNPYAFAEMLAVAGYFLTMAGDVAIQHVYSSRMQATTKSASSNGKGDPEAAAAAVAPCGLYDSGKNKV
jgi:zinc transporter 1/2/3